MKFSKCPEINKCLGNIWISICLTYIFYLCSITEGFCILAVRLPACDRCECWMLPITLLADMQPSCISCSTLGGSSHCIQRQCAALDSLCVLAPPSGALSDLLLPWKHSKPFDSVSKFCFIVLKSLLAGKCFTLLWLWPHTITKNEFVWSVFTVVRYTMCM